MMTLSCIIPAHNEARRIGSVLDAVVGHPLLDEIIVVDDDSTDETAQVAQRSGVTVLRLPENQGKSGAVAAGFARATGSHVLMLDADLIGLTADDITALVEPVRQNPAGVTISLRRNSPLFWRLIGLDYISGERVFARDLVGPCPDVLRSLPNFGLEVWLNQRWISRNVPVTVVRWPGVISPWKASKMGWLQGLRADLAMINDIFRTLSLPQVVRQILALKRISR